MTGVQTCALPICFPVTIRVVVALTAQCFCDVCDPWNNLGVFFTATVICDGCPVDAAVVVVVVVVLCCLCFRGGCRFYVSSMLRW